MPDQTGSVSSLRHCSGGLLLAALLCGAPATAADAPPDAHTLALSAVFRGQLAEAKPDGISLLYEIGPWLTPGQPAPGAPTTPLAALGDLHGQIGNGGFAQYFFNSGGDDWQQALRGLELLRDPEGTAILKAALAAFGPGGPPTDRAERQRFEDLVAANSSRFNDLDRRWYRHEADLGNLVITWLRANLDSLRFQPLDEPARGFQFIGSSQQQGVFQPLINLLQQSPQNRSCGWGPSDEDSFGFTIRSCLMSARDELNIIGLDANDPRCAALRDALVPLAPAVHLRCIIVGPATTPTDRPDLPWLLHIPDTTPASLERVRNWLGPRLWRKE
jgi:hypothetical protein